ncbi:HD domain-containing phosphohydrolase [Oscillospiraceae bacterium MB08-C2-2]|nr:HD domain-containing phosphohydrolase [Oscillospiraceae bacterium MB08-C2-2]
MADSILVIDDIEINRIILKEILSRDYDILEADGGLSAVEILFNTPRLPQAILLDIMMPGMDGFEVLSLLKSNPITEKIPVLFITAADAETNESKGLKAGAVDYISKPFNPDVVKARVDIHVKLFHYQNDLEAMVETKTKALTETHESILETLATIIEYRSLESGTHIRRTQELSGIMVDRMLHNAAFRDELLANDPGALIKATALHDIGKIGIPDSILLKPARLTHEEFEIIKTHTIIGGEILDSIGTTVEEQAVYLRHCKDICRSHHEKWNGSGYPYGLSGEAIPLSARILAVVDVYDALVNERCYKKAYPHDVAMNMLVEDSGKHFDPRLIETLLEVEEDFHLLELRLSGGKPEGVAAPMREIDQIPLTYQFQPWIADD